MEKMLRELVHNNISVTREQPTVAREQPNPQRAREFAVAAAVIGGRYCSAHKAQSALGASDLSLDSVNKLVDELRGHATFTAEAKAREKERYAKQVAQSLSTNGFAEEQRGDIIWVETRLMELLALGADALTLSDQNRCLWRWTFELSERDERRFFA